MSELCTHVALKASVVYLGWNGVELALVGDISCAGFWATDTGADPSVLANLRAEGLKVTTADPGAG